MNINDLKKYYQEKYNLTEFETDYKIFFIENGEYPLVAIDFNNQDSNDDIFYLFDSKDNNKLMTPPIAQIKYQKHNDKTLFIRRLEFVNNNYKGKGIASKFMDKFESFAIKNGYKKLIGEFVPLHGEDEEKVARFYMRNDFCFELVDNKLCVTKSLKENLDNDNNELSM